MATSPVVSQSAKSGSGRVPMENPPWPSVLRQPLSGTEPSCVEVIQRGSFPGTLQERWQEWFGSHPPMSTKENGTFSVLGVVTGIPLC